MKTTTSFTYPAFALFVFACFALSPQAHATQVATPTLRPTSAPNCAHSVSVTVSSTTSGAKIICYIWDGTSSTGGDTGVNPYVATVGSLGTKTLSAMAYKTGMTNSDWASATYTYHCGGLSPKEKIVLVIGAILLVAGLIWLFVKKFSANR